MRESSHDARLVAHRPRWAAAPTRQRQLQPLGGTSPVLPPRRRVGLIGSLLLLLNFLLVARSAVENLFRLALRETARRPRKGLSRCGLLRLGFFLGLATAPAATGGLPPSRQLVIPLGVHLVGANAKRAFVRIDRGRKCLRGGIPLQRAAALQKDVAEVEERAVADLQFSG